MQDLKVLFNREIPVISDKTCDHSKSVSRLVHGHHVTSVVDSQEVKVSELAHLTGSYIVDHPLFVLGIVELLLVRPFGGSGPCFATSPVTDPVFITRVDEHFDIAVVKELGNLWHEILHPVS